MCWHCLNVLYVHILLFHLQDGCIVQAKWPNLLGDGVVNELAIEEIQYLVKVTHEFRVRLKKMITIKEKVCTMISMHFHKSGTFLRQRTNMRSLHLV